MAPAECLAACPTPLAPSPTLPLANALASKLQPQMPAATGSPLLALALTSTPSSDYVYAEGEDEAFLAFLLYPTTQAPVLQFAQEIGSNVIAEVCHMTQTWLYQHHRARLRSLDLWEYLV